MKPEQPPAALARPFCASARAVAAFDAWIARLADRGVELDEADRVIVGHVARAQAVVEQLGLDIELAESAARRPKLGEVTRVRLAAARLKLMEAQRKAAADFRVSVGWLQDALGERLAESADEEPAAAFRPPSAGPRVVAFGPVARGRVEDRIVAVLAKAPSGLSREDLERRVRADRKAFLKALKQLQRDRRIERKGAGRRGRPYSYHLTEAA